MSYKILDERDIDLKYSPNSENAQSGKAVAEAIANVGGTPEIYVGSGDMPEGYVLKIDPNGDEVFEVEQTYNPESENPQSGKAVAEASNYKQLFDTLEVTQEAVDAAGQDGITILTVGSDDIDLSKYNDIVIKCYIPQSDALNTEVGRCFVALTKNKNYSTADENVFLRIQATGATAVFTHNKANVISFRGVWCNDNFLFGQSMKNGAGTSHGLQNWQECWISIASNFFKSQKKYFHITGGTSSGNCTFKFPVGTTISIYGR